MINNIHDPDSHGIAPDYRDPETEYCKLCCENDPACTIKGRGYCSECAFLLYQNQIEAMVSDKLGFDICECYWYVNESYPLLVKHNGSEELKLISLITPKGEFDFRINK